MNLKEVVAKGCRPSFKGEAVRCRERYTAPLEERMQSDLPDLIERARVAARSGDEGAKEFLSRQGIVVLKEESS